MVLINGFTNVSVVVSPLRKPIQARTPLSFSGASVSPEYVKADTVFREKAMALLKKVFYQNDQEVFTGADLFRAIKKAGYKSLINPFVMANPIKWVQMTIAACNGDGYSQWVTPKSLVRNLPLRYNVRTPQEERNLLSCIKETLEEFGEVGMVDYRKDDQPVHVFLHVSRPTHKGKLAYRLLQAEQSGKAKPDKKNAEAMAATNGTADKLKKDFETQIEKVKQKQQQLDKDSADIRARIAQEVSAQKALETDLNAMTKAPERMSFMDLSKQPTAEELEEKKLMLRADIKNKGKLIKALELQLQVAEELRIKCRSEAHQAILLIKEALADLEITRVQSETLRLSGKLKEKEAMDAELLTRIESVKEAYTAVESALKAENIEGYLDLIRQVRALESWTKTEPPAAQSSDTLKVEGAPLAALEQKGSEAGH